MRIKDNDNRAVQAGNGFTGKRDRRGRTGLTLLWLLRKSANRLICCDSFRDSKTDMSHDRLFRGIIRQYKGEGSWHRTEVLNTWVPGRSRFIRSTFRNSPWAT